MSEAAQQWLPASDLTNEELVERVRVLSGELSHVNDLLAMVRAEKLKMERTAKADAEEHAGKYLERWARYEVAAILSPMWGLVEMVFALGDRAAASEVERLKSHARVVANELRRVGEAAKASAPAVPLGEESR